MCEHCDKLAKQIEADYSSVQAKAATIYRAGGVTAISLNPSYSEFSVTSTTGSTYMVLLGFTENLGIAGDPKDKLKEWTCSCNWGKWNFDRSAPWAYLEGRLCSHSLAALYFLQALVYKGQPFLKD